MSAARPLSSLLSAGAVVALTLAAPGTALADSGGGAGQAKGQQDAQRQDQSQSQGQQGKGHPDSSSKASSTPVENKASSKSDSKPDRKPGATGGRGTPAEQPAARTPRTAPQAPATRSGDPAGNNGTIKIDTVPSDQDRANRPHPGCAFVLQFFGFDADQHADITFTGQSPTRSSGPLLTLRDQLISTSPADGALEAGHSLTLSAADLGLLGTPTAAKGWHVKVAVDAIEAPGGAKQKVFWLDCAGDPAAVEQEADEADAAGSGAADESLAEPAPAGQATVDSPLSASDDELAVLSGSATRGDAGTSGASAAAAGDLAGEQQGRSTTSTLASVLPFAVPAALPFTGAAGVTGMLVAGLGAVAVGALALRTGRRRTTG